MSQEYILKRSDRSRNIRLRVDATGKLMVSAHTRTPQHMIDKFILDNENWIARARAKINLKKEIFPILDWEQGILSYLGLVYNFRFDPTIDKKIVVTKGEIKVRPVTENPADLRKTLLNWLKKEAVNYLETKTPIIADRMGVKYNLLKYKQQVSRWGSCSSNGVICFNWRLIHFSQDVIDYVIIHELTHLTHMDHSADFWQRVAQFDVDYKRKVSFLKKQMMVIEKI